MKNAIATLVRLLRDRAGSSILEFAVGSGLLVAAGTATFQYGYIFYQYNELKNSVSTGARWASLAAYDSATTTPSSAYLAKVKNMVVYGTPTAGNAPVVANLSPSNVQLDVAFNNGVPESVKVSITGFTIQGVFGSMSCTDKPAVEYAYQGVWAPAP